MNRRRFFYTLASLVLVYLSIFPILYNISSQKRETLFTALRTESLIYLRSLSEYLNYHLKQYELLLETPLDSMNFATFLEILRKDVIRVQEIKNVLLLDGELRILQALYPAGSCEKGAVDFLMQKPKAPGGTIQCSLFPFDGEVHVLFYRAPSALPLSTRGSMKEEHGILLLLSSIQLLPEHGLFPYPLEWISLVEPSKQYMLLYQAPADPKGRLSIEPALGKALGPQGTGIEFSADTLMGWDTIQSLPLKVILSAGVNRIHTQYRLFSAHVYAGGYGAATLLFFLVWFLVRYKMKTLSQARELKVRETILQETHHRIKNNIQTISSLLDLQREGTKDPVIQHSFSLAISRLRVIAQLHEELYRQDSLSEVRLKEYCGNLLTTLLELYDLNEKQISIQTEIDDDLFLDMKRAQSCGFIVHELVTNSLKHAFLDGKGGTIRVRIQKSSGTILLSVEDTGVGLKDSTEHSSGLGLVILHAMAQQLKGTVEVDGSEGMKVRVVFPC